MHREKLFISADRQEAVGFWDATCVDDLYSPENFES